MPEPYDLQELMKYQTDMNRFNSVNPWGSQTWSTDPSGKMTMTQDISPELQGIYDQQLSFLNQGNTPYEMPGPLQDSYQGLMDKRSQIWGAQPGYRPDVPATSVSRGTPGGQQMGPPAPEQPATDDRRSRLAEALRSMGGDSRFAQSANRVMDNADMFKMMRDKYRSK